MNRIILATIAVAVSSVGGLDGKGAEWRVTDVPGEQDIRGYAWYRTWFKPHATFFSNHERDLWGESVILNIRGLQGAHEAFVNGIRIGIGGAFPPEFAEGRRGTHRHKIPPGTLIRDQWNELAVRVFVPGNEDGDGGERPGGFLADAPFVMNYFWECVLEGPWEFRSGDDFSWLGGAVKPKPVSSGFDMFRESNRVLGEAAVLIHGDKLSPRDSFAKMRTDDGFTVELMLSEPEVAQPTHFSFDSKGRLWIAQYRQYPYPAGLKMVSRDRYYRSHYDRMPPPPPNHVRGRDRVTIHEDTDGNGRYDKHTVFQDGLNMANAVVRGRGGVWVMHTPYLLFYPDQDFDDVPDGPPVAHLEGFGFEDTHSVANGLVWGVDGWLYGAQGSTTSCHVTRPGIDPNAADGVYFQGCMVWRYHPETRRFEIFAEGGGNNFGLEVDAAGRLFTGHNGGETRGWHYLQGGLHLMQGKTPNKFGPPRNPFAFGELPKMKSEQPISRFTHFLAVAEGTAIPEQFHGAFLSLDPLHNFVIASKRIPDGATFRTTDIGKVLESDDSAFRPVYIANAPDGSLLIADFYEHYIAHGQHYQSQIDPTTGRVYRLRGRTTNLERDINLDAKPTGELIVLLGHPNKWHRHTAARLLGERKDPGSEAALRDRVRRGEDVAALCAFWALYQGFGLDWETAFAALTHAYPPMRVWAVRLICDDIGFANKQKGESGLIDHLGNLPNGSGRVGSELFAALLDQARAENDAEVRSQMAASARRLAADQAIELVRVGLSHDEDLKDPYVPLLCWYVFEANLDRAREAIMDLFDEPSFRSQPMVQEHLLERMMRALALKGRNRDLEDCARLLERARGGDQIDRLLAGFELAYQGRRMNDLPPRLARALVKEGRTSLLLRLRLGDVSAIGDAIRTLRSDEAAIETRMAIARMLGEINAERDGLKALMETATAESEPRLQRAALAALTAFDDPTLGEFLLKMFPSISAEARPALFDFLLSRVEWTRIWMTKLESGDFPATAVPKEFAIRLARHSDKGIRQIAEARLGRALESVSTDLSLNMNMTETRVREALASGEGSPYAGEEAFNDRCGACHRLFHKGGNIGPDLTPYQRNNLDTLLVSVIQPNAEIREGYEYVSLETVDGRQLSGFVVDSNSQVVSLRGMAGEDMRVERSAISVLEPMGRSLMPEGLLEGLNDQQLRDFFAYLRISQPISQ